MNISLQDGSNYFRGLLLLIRKDGKITLPEIENMRRIGTSLGFEKEFIESCIQEILDNEFVADHPPIFSSNGLAMMFLRDGLTIAVSDMEIHPNEEAWLKIVADKNGISPEWLLEEKQKIIYHPTPTARLEVENLRMM